MQPNGEGPVRLEFDRGTLLLRGLAGEAVRALASADVWTWDGRVGAWRCDAIHYAGVGETLAATLGSAWRDEVPKALPVRWPKVALPPLRPEQVEALAAWRNAGRRGQVIMPTGTGKTEVALAAMAETATATLVVAPIRDLLYQWRRRILKVLGYDAGIVGDSLHNLQPVTVTTYDSAYIHMGEIGARFGLVVLDEEHHLPGPCRREAALMCAAPMR